MNATPTILCLGAMLWDLIGRSPARLVPGDDVPGRITQQPGGVALNVALALARQGLQPAILSSIGLDAPGEALMAEAARRGVDTRYLWRQGQLPTDSYMAIESPEGLFAAIADTRALEAAGQAILAPLRDGRLGNAAQPWCGTLVVDGNLTPQVLGSLTRDPCLSGVSLRIVPASPDKAARLWPLLQHPRAIFHLNRAEAEALTGRNFRSAARAAEAVLALGAPRVLVTDGHNLAADAQRGARTLSELPPQVAAIRVTGAGDAFLAAHFAAELSGSDRAEALSSAIRAAAAHISAKDLP